MNAAPAITRMITIIAPAAMNVFLFDAADAGGLDPAIEATVAGADLQIPKDNNSGFMSG